MQCLLFATKPGVQDDCDAGQQWKPLAEAAHFNVSELAVLCQMSRRQLERDFRRFLGCSPQAWLDEVRMEKARELLLKGAPVKCVAYDLSFKYTSYFCRKFKLKNKLKPSEFIAANVPRPSRIATVGGER
jgi:AraC-like DNA-binding protein